MNPRQQAQAHAELPIQRVDVLAQPRGCLQRYAASGFRVLGFRLEAGG